MKKKTKIETPVINNGTDDASPVTLESPVDPNFGVEDFASPPVMEPEPTPLVPVEARNLSVLAEIVSESRFDDLIPEEYAVLIESAMRSAESSLRHATMLGWEASQRGRLDDVMECLKAHNRLAPQTIYQLHQTITRSLPFLAQNGIAVETVPNLDGLRSLLPKITVASPSGPTLVDSPEAASAVDRLRAGESPAVIAKALRTTGPVSSIASRIQKLADEINKQASKKHRKQDGETMLFHAIRVLFETGAERQTVEHKFDSLCSKIFMEKGL